MKYVDEFRDSTKAGFLIKEIGVLMSGMRNPSDEPLYIMEVCGGHTHSIFRYGIEGMLPSPSSWCMGRAARSACFPSGGWTMRWPSPNART